MKELQRTHFLRYSKLRKLARLSRSITKATYDITVNKAMFRNSKNNNLRHEG